MKKKYLILIFLSLLPFQLSSQSYMGLGVGLSIYNQDIFTDLNHAASNNDMGMGYKFFAGYKFNDYLGIEGAYNLLGTAKSENSSDNFTSELTAISLSGVLSLPNDIGGISPFVKVGYNQLSTKFNYSSTPSDTEKDSVYNIQYGVGADYNLDDFFIRLEYEIFGETGTDGTTAGSIVNDNEAQLVKPTQFTISIGKKF
jgi:hypothetical protein